MLQRLKRLWSFRRHNVNKKMFPTLTSDGTIIYQQKGWEPPPTPAGYHRKSEDFTSKDAWVFILDTPLCKHLGLHKLRSGACSCVSVIPTCHFEDTLRVVTRIQCSQCSHWQKRNTK